MTHSLWMVRIQRQDGVSQEINVLMDAPVKRPRIAEFAQELRQAIERLEDAQPAKAQFSRDEAAERRRKKRKS